MYNIILTTRNEEIQFTGETAKFLRSVLFTCAQLNGWKVEKIVVGLNYVQILVWLTDDISVEDAIKRFKKAGQLFIGHEFKNILGRVSFDV